MTNIKKLNKGWIEIKKVTSISNKTLFEVICIRGDDDHEFVVGNIIICNNDKIRRISAPKYFSDTLIIYCDDIYMSIEITEPTPN